LGCDPDVERVLRESEIRTLFVGDLLVCDCLRQPLALAGFEISGRVRGLKEAHALVAADCAENDQPAILLADMDAAGVNDDSGSLRRLRDDTTQLKLVILTSALSPSVLTQAWDADVDGCLLKDLSLKLLVRSLQLIVLGQRILPEQLRCLEPGPVRRSWANSVDRGGLSAREEQILRLLLLGDSNKQIASRLGIGDVAVKLHLKTLLHKLGARNRTQVAIWAHNHGYGVVAEQSDHADRE
jgi:two-component system nitrate/nitrite response regulator NarL